MGHKPGDRQLRTDLNEDTLDEFWRNSTGRYGLTQREVLERLMRFYNAQPPGLRLMVLGLTDGDDERDLARAILRRMAKGE